MVAAAKPVVCANRIQHGVALESVTVNEYEGALSLAAHLLDAGHRRAAYLEGPARSWPNKERSRALMDAAAFGIEFLPRPGGSDMQDGYAVADAVAEAARAGEFTAVVAFNDHIALGLLSRLRELGVTVPDDLSVAGFDGIPHAAFAFPPLTTVRLPSVELGRLAWQHLLGQLDGVVTDDPTPLRCELIVRSSVAVVGAAAAHSLP